MGLGVGGGDARDDKREASGKQTELAMVMGQVKEAKEDWTLEQRQLPLQQGWWCWMTSVAAGQLGAGDMCVALKAPEGLSLQCSDEVELLPVLAGEDGGLFVVFHQFVHGVKPPLPDAVDIVHELHLEVLVLP